MGGKRKALEEALRVRAEFERKLGKPRTERMVRGDAQSIDMG